MLINQRENDTGVEEKNFLIELDLKTLKEMIAQNVEIIKLMDNSTRYRLIFLLLIFPRLSLSELSKFLGRTKSTIIHHLKKFEEFNVLKTTRKSVHSYIDAKIYELIPDVLNILNFNIKDFETFSNDEKKALMPSMILKDIWVFELFKNILEKSILLYKAIGQVNLDAKLDSSKELTDFYLKNPIKYDIWTLTKKEFELYNNLIEEFKLRLNKSVQENNEKKGDIERPFLVLHSLFPMKDMIKFDSETKKYIKFYRALE